MLPDLHPLHLTNCLILVLSPHVSAVYYKAVPNFKTMSNRIQEVLVKAISINSGYTSIVQVCLGFFYDSM